VRTKYWGIGGGWGRVVCTLRGRARKMNPPVCSCGAYLVFVCSGGRAEGIGPSHQRGGEDGGARFVGAGAGG